VKIKYKLIITTLGFSLIIIWMFLSTWIVTEKQKSDALVINLSGRERMLLQKMVKELLFYKMHGDATYADNVKNTMKIFDKTLSALKDSGEAPISIDINNSETKFCPKATEPAYSQLEKVKAMWNEMSGKIEHVLAGNEAHEEDILWIMENNMPLLKELDKSVTMLQKQSEGKVSYLLILQFTGILIGIAFTIFSMLTLRFIIKRLDNINKFAIHLGSGDLTALSHIDGNDELGFIGISLDNMVKNLRQMFAGIIENANKLDGSSVKLSGISKELSQSSVNVSDRINNVATATEEMSSNMHAVAAAMEETSVNVSMVASAAEEMNSTITEIARNTEKASSITRDAVNQSSVALSKVSELGTVSEEIGNIIETINEIADQTNLLALNATIEAARAGEAGKGFSVVASEVKTLAKQTSLATEEIRGKIENIQNVTKETSHMIEEISKVVHNINDIVTIIATAVEEQSITTSDIASNVVNASQGIQEVNVNVSQTSAVSSEIAKDILDVTGSVREISSGGANVNINADDLLSLASKLKNMVEKFKV
jgi:methyl-accepting chemotaxis protein